MGKVYTYEFVYNSPFLHDRLLNYVLLDDTLLRCERTFISSYEAIDAVFYLCDARCFSPGD